MSWINAQQCWHLKKGSFGHELDGSVRPHTTSTTPFLILLNQLPQNSHLNTSLTAPAAPPPLCVYVLCVYR